MSLNLEDNKRPYFPQLDLNATFDEIQAAFNDLSVKEFIIIGGGDTFAMTIGAGLINGKKWFELPSEGVTMTYNSTDARWEYSQGTTLMAYVSSVDDIPPSGDWTVDGGTIWIEISNYNFTLQESIESLFTNVFELQTDVYMSNSITLTQVDLVNLPDAGIEIMPDMAEGYYYIVDKFVFEGRFGTIPYTGGSSFFINANGTAIVVATVPVTIATASFDTLWTNGSFNQTAVYAANKGFSVGMNSYLADGDGDVKITMYYKIIKAA